MDSPIVSLLHECCAGFKPNVDVSTMILDSIANDIPRPELDVEVKAKIIDEPHNIENADGKKL